MRFVWSLLAALSLAACATMSGGGGGDRVDEVHLFGLPVTLNLDGKPGADGFAVRVFLTKGGGAKGSTIQSGNLEVLMFDGVVGSDEIAAKEPKQIWKFTPRQLAPLREQTSLGNGYRFALRWDQPPTHGYITVVARYVPPKGGPVYSSPSTITATMK
jgi:hypothetical protein